ncbi:MAG: deoxyribose-phosphate aldolase [candidate division WOR-3 bacterium]
MFLNPKSNILTPKLIDHTNLKVDAQEIDIEKLCKESIEYNFRGVCVNPVWVPFVSKILKNTPVKVISVGDFPLGSSLSEARKKEAEVIMKSGGDEVDFVLQIPLFKSKKYKEVERDLREIAEIIHPDGKLKVIIEAPILTEDEIKDVVKIVEASGADFIKTGTGTKGPVTIFQVKKIKENTTLPIKASGGIRDIKTAIELIKEGASILGSSNGVKIVRDLL